MEYLYSLYIVAYIIVIIIKRKNGERNKSSTSECVKSLFSIYYVIFVFLFNNPMFILYNIIHLFIEFHHSHFSNANNIVTYKILLDWSKDNFS